MKTKVNLYLSTQFFIQDATFINGDVRVLKTLIISALIEYSWAINVSNYLTNRIYV